MTNIRRAQKTDYSVLPLIEADAAQAFKEWGLTSVAEMEPSPAAFYLQLPENAGIFVSEDKISGITGFSVVTELDGQAYLKEISVRRTASGRGVGQSLLEHAIVWAEARYRWMVLSTFADLPFNAPFYRKAGFQDFTPDDDWPELRALRIAERKAGLDVSPRITMKLELNDG